MTEGPGFLEFFILEASEYVEQLDGLVLGGGSGGPDADALQRVARALRGTATMAKIPAFADLAAAIERVGRALHDGALRWEPTLGGALVAAIDDLKALLHSARAWSPNDDRRASVRSAELARFAPPRSAPANAATQASPFLSTEAANVAAGLELLTTRASDADTAANVLRRIRALRGVAGVKEIGPLAEALEATEAAGRALESGQGELTPEARHLLETAAVYLRTLASALRTGGDVNAPTPAREAFENAHEAWSSSDAERERVVPISTLFYGDGDAGLVEASQHPPTTASQRFHLELVSLGEHLRQVVDAARAANDPGSKARVQREIRRTLHALQSAADSFGERDVAEFVRSHSHTANSLDFFSISALDDLASVLAQPGAGGERLRARLRELAGGREIATAIGVGFGRETPRTTPSVPTPVAPLIPTPVVSAPPAIHSPAPIQPPAPTVAPPAPPAPVPPPPAPPLAAPRVSEPVRAGIGARRDSGAAALLDSGIDALTSLGTNPLLQPTPLADDHTPLVPIESLLYRGRAALDRAVEIRDQLRHAGPPDPDALEELYDLLELARAE